MVVLVPNDLLIACFRTYNPDLKLSNDLLGRIFWLHARKLDPSARKLGKRPSIFKGFGGLPKTSEEIELSSDARRELFDFAISGAPKTSEK